MAGFVPGVGAFADIGSGAISLAQGNLVAASNSALTGVAGAMGTIAGTAFDASNAYYGGLADEVMQNVKNGAYHFQAQGTPAISRWNGLLGMANTRASYIQSARFFGRASVVLGAGLGLIDGGSAMVGGDPWHGAFKLGIAGGAIGIGIVTAPATVPAAIGASLLIGGGAWAADALGSAALNYYGIR